MIKLHPHQEEAKAFLLSKRRAILADSMRLGKTLSTASAAAHNLPAFILCPSSVKNHWASEFTRVNSKLKIDIAHKGTHEFGLADVYIMNYELLGKVEPPKHVTLVLDESHKIKNPQAKRTKASMKLIKKATYAYALSGTPMPSRPVELWPLLYSMGITRFGWYDFTREFCAAWDAPWGRDVSGASNLKSLARTMEPYVLRRTKESVFPAYRPPEFRLITFDLPVDRKESKFDKAALVEHPNPILAFEGLADIMLQSGLKKIPDAIEFIEDLLNSEQQVVVFGHHKAVIDALEEKLAKYKPLRLTGDTPSAKRGELVKQFKENSEHRVFLGNVIAAGEGIDLSTADTIVFVESSWVPGVIQQAAARTESMVKMNSAAQIYLLTTEASIDHYVLKRVLEKIDIIKEVKL